MTNLSHPPSIDDDGAAIDVVGGLGGQVDDAAPVMSSGFLRQHQATYFLAQEKDGVQVNVDDKIPVFLGEIDRFVSALYTGIVGASTDSSLSD
jgi:hypothetical protein